MGIDAFDVVVVQLQVDRSDQIFERFRTQVGKLVVVGKSKIEVRR